MSEGEGGDPQRIMRNREREEARQALARMEAQLRKAGEIEAIISTAHACACADEKAVTLSIERFRAAVGRWYRAAIRLRELERGDGGEGVTTSKERIDPARCQGGYPAPPPTKRRD